MYQRTIKSPVAVEGNGLHTGSHCKLDLVPAPPNTGILFHKRVGRESVAIPALAENVVNTKFATTIGLHDNSECSIMTIEHLMAALLGLGIDNVHCYVDGPEIPMLDGCSHAYVELLQGAQLQSLDQTKRVLRVVDSVCCADGDAWAILKPHCSFRLNVQIAYEHSSFNDPMVCHASFDSASQSFVEELSHARTYGFRFDHSYLKAEGRAQGIDENTQEVLIFDRETLPAGTKLRYPNEAARHKILDAYGDLALTGFGEILGSYTGYKAGHTLNYRLVKKLLAQQSSFEEVLTD